MGYCMHQEWEINLVNQPKLVYFLQTDKDSLHPATQSYPDSQTAPHQARNTWRSCNAARSLHHNTGFTVGRAGMRYPLPWFRFLVCPNRYNRRTKPVCLRYRSSLSGCRFDRIGSSGFVGGFHRLRWFNRGFVLKVHSCRNRCRYRYICRPVGLPARGGCCSERIRLLLWGRMKNKNRVRATYTLCQDWRFCAGYDLLPGLIIA